MTQKNSCSYGASELLLSHEVEYIHFNFRSTRDWRPGSYNVNGGDWSVVDQEHKRVFIIGLNGNKTSASYPLIDPDSDQTENGLFWFWEYEVPEKLEPSFNTIL